MSRAFALTAAVVATTFAMGVPAHAVDVESGTFDVVSEVGDPVGGGYPYSYVDGAGSGDSMYAGWNDEQNSVHVIVLAANGDRWDLTMGAPSGEQLAVGTYSGASDTPSLSGAKLAVDGTFYGCESEGAFTVDRLELGPRGYVEALDASFGQNCEDTVPGLTGQAHLTNPPPPAELSLRAHVDATGSVSADGRATVRGTVTCTEPVDDVLVNGRIEQVVGKDALATATYYTHIACTPGAPVAWSAVGTAGGGVPFAKGDASVGYKAQATDPVYGHTVVTDPAATATVSLRKD
ncbi:hypothetical protein [Streptomyces endophyticus]|uniref:Uncharacterized protein n=1 Tax=Streptomyces endophyticus TaxID=714166 RepID=A0ABU6FJM4_9ACTN|nr:hypothetical protein [Streptomyces endophyticus]MEB8344242.1 hypothetical protein [Streptomyces endophyticus]